MNRSGLGSALGSGKALLPGMGTSSFPGFASGDLLNKDLLRNILCLF